MRFVTASEMRELDRRAAAEFNLPTPVLMQSAGLAVAEAVRRVADIKGVRDLPVLLFAGRGNNGGDVFAATRYLAEWGFRCQIFSSSQTAEAVGGLPPTVSVYPIGPDCVRPLSVPRGTLVVDGLLGTGLHGDPRGPEADAIRCIQALRGMRGAFVIAVDVPSGMNADTGAFGLPSVSADLTVTLALPKLGMASESDEIAPHCGRIEVANIGFPSALSGPDEENGLALIAGASVETLPRRPRAAHKGYFGHVVLVGGSARYTGAIALAAEAAARGGAGLVSVATVREAALPLRARLPEAMVRVVDAPSLSRDGLGTDFPAFLRKCGTLVVGPGLGLADDALGALECVLESGVARAVVDADALTLLAAHPDLLDALPPDTVLTPHPGEAARLLGIGPDDVQRDRPAALRALVEKTGRTVVLKGAGTLVGAPGRGRHILRGGNPGMATGGSGDVLAGIVGALLAQWLPSFDAARAAVWLHAKRGDEAAWRKGEAALLARDIIP